jgi:hypothetical protein
VPGGARPLREPDPHRALARATELAGEEGSVLVTGSLYLLADLADELAPDSPRARPRWAILGRPVRRERMAAGSSTLVRILFTILLLLAVAVVSFFIGYLIGPPLLNRVLS